MLGAMDRAIVEEYLAQAERHVKQGDRHIESQRRIVAELERSGHIEAAGRARSLLTQFEEIQLAHIADRDRLKEELRNANRA